MKSRALVRMLPLGAALVAGPLVVGEAVAQEADAPAEGAPVEAAPAGDTGAAPAGTELTGLPGEVGEDGVYTVKTGDTLWDLSQEFLANPWYWPKIWADNPQVENPHWIYPGNRLKLRAGGDGLPAEVEPVAEEDTGDAPVARKPKELASFTTGTIGKAEQLNDEEDIVTFAGDRLKPFSSRGRLRLASLLLAKELEQAGTISGSFEQKQLLTTGDSVYLELGQLGQARIGTEYTVFRRRESIQHPRTGAPAGVIVDVLGTVKLVAKEGRTGIGVVGGVIDAVQRGDLVSPVQVEESDLAPSANAADLSGVVLTSAIPFQQQIGETHVVFVDKGAKDGVRTGNTFTVVQAGDGLQDTKSVEPKGMPLEPVATLLVVDVRDGASAAVVLRSLREVAIGDRVEMRQSNAGAGGDAR